MNRFTCPQTGAIRDYDEERAQERRKSDALRWAVRHHRAAEIDRVCARYELESDEFQTAEEKAQELIHRGKKATQ